MHRQSCDRFILNVEGEKWQSALTASASASLADLIIYTELRPPFGMETRSFLAVFSNIRSDKQVLRRDFR